jgi:hypothetical protein
VATQPSQATRQPLLGLCAWIEQHHESKCIYYSKRVWLRTGTKAISHMASTARNNHVVPGLVLLLHAKQVRPTNHQLGTKRSYHIGRSVWSRHPHTADLLTVPMHEQEPGAAQICSSSCHLAKQQEMPLYGPPACYHCVVRVHCFNDTINLHIAPMF